MATFVTLATCHHCPITSTWRGLIYRDSLSVLARNLGAPESHRMAAVPQWRDLHGYRVTRTDPGSITVSQEKPSGGMKHLVVTHLRRLLTLGPAHQRKKGLQLPG